MIRFSLSTIWKTQLEVQVLGGGVVASPGQPKATLCGYLSGEAGAGADEMMAIVAQRLPGILIAQCPMFVCDLAPT